VQRHSIHAENINPEAPLTVGNGEFAFTADVTGLQTLNTTYLSPPLQTMTHSTEYGWHTIPASQVRAAPSSQRINPNRD